MSRRQTWLAALAGGVAGTSLMTLTLDLHAKLRPDARDGLIDYDASDHVVIAASKVMRWSPPSRLGRTVLFDIVHWGYGSAVAVEYDELRRALRSEPAAAVVFYAACQSMAFALFPLLGDTPPPWRWSRGMLASSMAEHALYVTTVALVSRAVRERIDA